MVRILCFLLLVFRIQAKSDTSDKCEVGNPLTGTNNVELFCGRGSTRVDCPDGYLCNIGPADEFAVCCEEAVTPPKKKATKKKLKRRQRKKNLKKKQQRKQQLYQL
eukprot:181820_1